MKWFWKQLVIFVLWTSFLYIGYQLTNRYQIFSMHLMPQILGEENIPFLVWTVLPYLLLIDLMYLPIFINDRLLFKQALIALTIGVLINYCVFIFYPTSIMRPPPPINEGFVNGVYHWLLSIDTPANCFPSGHITSPSIGCWFFAKAYPKTKWGLLSLLIILYLVVLTTKQHYILDILGGLSTGYLGIYCSKKLIKEPELK